MALGIALVLSIGTTYVFYARVKRQAAERGETRKIVGAATALQAGTPLTAQNLTLIDWPVVVPIEGAFATEKKDELVGKAVIFPIGAREPIRERDLATPGSGVSVTAKIPEGMRALAVKTNEVNNVAGFLYPGCHVDVLATILPGGGERALTRTVLQDVQVLTVGARSEPDPSGKPENVSVVTLLLSPNDAQRLVLATTQGTIQFVLRNGADSKHVETTPVDMAELTSGVKKPAAVAARPAGRRAAPVKAPAVYTVETVAGDKKSVAKFEH